MPPRRRRRNPEATRAAIISAARALFTVHGYAETPLETVASEADVTRGALYHHFEDKRALFLAVFVALQEELAAKLLAAADLEADPWSRFVRGVDTFLDACLEPEFRRIALIDAPAVLGPDVWRSVEERYGLGITEASLKSVMEAGAIAQQPVRPLAHVVLGALQAAGLAIAQASTAKRRARRETGASVHSLLRGLRAGGAANRSP